MTLVQSKRFLLMTAGFILTTNTITAHDAVGSPHDLLRRPPASASTPFRYVRTRISTVRPNRTVAVSFTSALVSQKPPKVPPQPRHELYYVQVTPNAAARTAWKEARQPGPVLYVHRYGDIYFVTLRTPRGNETHCVHINGKYLGRC